MSINKILGEKFGFKFGKVRLVHLGILCSIINIVIAILNENFSATCGWLAALMLNGGITFLEKKIEVMHELISDILSITTVEIGKERKKVTALEDFILKQQEEIDNLKKDKKDE